MAKLMYTFEKQELDKFKEEMETLLGRIHNYLEACESDKPCHSSSKKQYIINARLCSKAALILLNDLKK